MKNTIGQIIKEMINDYLDNNLLRENKTVTFNGQTFPKYGWAVILAGGAGVGKSTTIREKLPIQGKLISADFYKEFYADIINAEQFAAWKGDGKFSTHDGFVNGGDENTSKYMNRKGKPFPKRNGVIWDLRRKEDAIEINRHAGDGYHEPYSQNYVDRQRNNLKKSISNTNYLPNLIFDTAGVNQHGIEEAFNLINTLGKNGQKYKVAVVWVLANRGVAFASMQNRDRIVPDDAFHKAHNQIMNKNQGVQKLLKKYANNIDEAWLVLNSSYDDTENGRILRRPNSVENLSNVIKLEKNTKGKFIILDTFNAMGKETSLSDILGTTQPHMGRRNPKDEEEISRGVFPTGKNAEEYAKTHNGRYIKNVDVFSKQDELKKQKERELERYKQGKLGQRHSSLI